MTDPSKVFTPILFKQWLNETKVLQEEVYHADFDHFAWDGEDTDKIVNLVHYIDTMFAATVHEMIELHDETSWKPWQHDEPYVNRNAVMKEAIDALHFISNILCAVGVTDDELTQEYLKKMQINRDRQERAEGYHVLAAGVKCLACKRALDDVPASEEDPSICVECFKVAVPHA